MSCTSDAPPRTVRVVLVDDAEDLRYLVRFALELGGEFEVVGEAGDGHTGIAAVEQFQPDLVLLDVSMPGLDGLEALPAVCAAAPAARVVMLSGFEQRRLGRMAVDRGAAAYLEKGLAPAELVAALRDVLGSELPPTLPAPSTEQLTDDELLAVAAHDLRGPLAAVIGFGETLAESWDLLPDTMRRDMVGRMTAQSRTMQHITENLLTGYAAETGSLRVSPEEVVLERVLPGITESLRPQAPRHDLRLAVVPGLPTVLADVGGLTQVLANLVGNAARYSPAGSAVVILAEQDDEGGVVVSVADQGPGIPLPDRRRVFGKNVRLGSNLTGLGLGLFVSAQLVGAMGGAIWVADEPGGARLCVRLRAAS